MSKNSIKAIVKRVSIVLIMILGFIFVIFLPVWVYCVAYWIKGEKVTNRYIQFIFMEKSKLYKNLLTKLTQI